ncbi:MAG: polyprenyl synthetase family protein [Oscillospiraceae bacterium]|nr:polyprenyl synthetase family protein [Oscillospiraceae bacterium]
MKENKISSFKKLIDEKINEYFSQKISSATYNKLLYESMFYSMKNGGKRIRPILFLLVLDMYRLEFSEYIDFALALEMIHCYSLIHDDLPCMDDDDIRRGKPTNHKVYGEAIALLAGDALLNEAFEILFKLSLKDDLCTKASYEIAKAVGGFGMIGGQTADILGENKVLSEEELIYIHENKTGKLIKASIASAGILCDIDESELEILSMIGEKLGLAFQIKDDILDVIGDEEKLGKSINSDEKNQKFTFVTLYGLERSKEIYDDLSNACLTLLDKFLHSRNKDLFRSFINELINRSY